MIIIRFDVADHLSEGCNLIIVGVATDFLSQHFIMIVETIHYIFNFGSIRFELWRRNIFECCNSIF